MAKPKRPRMPQEDEMVTLSFKVPATLVKSLDALAAKMEEEVRRERPGVNVTRTECIRSILIQAARSVEEKKD